jgi:hypothetical protein
MVSNLALFYFVWQFIWLLFKKLGDFFQIIWSLCLFLKSLLLFFKLKLLKLFIL